MQASTVRVGSRLNRSLLAVEIVGEAAGGRPLNTVYWRQTDRKPDSWPFVAYSDPPGDPPVP